VNFRPERKDELDLNITPLIDVVFLLLIFFMVSTTFERQSEISITLPKATESLKEVNPDVIYVAVDDQQRIFINETLLVNSRLETIREALQRHADGVIEPAIVINADANVTHQSVVRIMDAARQLSLTSITFSTQIDEEGASR
jgi:biopolymer transport protein ExbD